MKQTSAQFLDNASAALAKHEQVLRFDLLGKYMPAVRSKAMGRLDNLDELKAYIHAMKDHTLEFADFYLEQFAARVQANGGVVHWARDGDEMNRLVLELCQQHGTRKVGKGKSMVTEETGLNAFLEQNGLEVTETDLGEYIVQMAHEPPSHIVGPAFHKSLTDIQQLFRAIHPFGERNLDTPEHIVAEAREVLRDKFLNMEVSITGANALIAETGTIMLVTNEGNGDLCANIPALHIVCATIEKLVPKPEDAMSILRLLPRSVTGQSTTCYTSFYSSPRSDRADGSSGEFHIVLLDNRRTDMLGSDYQDMLRCIRCSACMNHCPIYSSVGGHAYGWVYPGPMGSVLTPLLTSLEQSHHLPNACTMCGRCAEVCPMEIPLPDLLRDLRNDESQQQLNARHWRWGMKAHAWLATQPWLYIRLTRIGVVTLGWLGRSRGNFRHLLVPNGWTAQRDFPTPEGDTFQALWKKRLQQPARKV